ncbi:MAG: hypothetical protein E6R07_08715 [Nevskiaceae bacterium]|nr:MAG: hypothetical protein E6R07_08715 [Nevskiaceae bacterium]
MPASSADREQPVVIETLGPTAQGFSFALEKYQGRLQLRALHRPDYGPIYADWLSREMRDRTLAGRNQLLARAIGLKKKQNLEVLDCTGGLGRDGFILAALGAEVLMTERQPFIFELLHDAHQRALTSASSMASAQRLEVRLCDAIDVIHLRRWDAIYLDPMFGNKGRTALPQKEMQVLQDLAEGPEDAAHLLQTSISSGASRVVVKRSLTAQYLNGLKPTLEFRGTKTRFDVYLNT